MIGDCTFQRVLRKHERLENFSLMICVLHDLEVCVCDYGVDKIRQGQGGHV
jgi:hypothetical protein